MNMSQKLQVHLFAYDLYATWIFGNKIYSHILLKKLDIMYILRATIDFQ